MADANVQQLLGPLYSDYEAAKGALERKKAAIDRIAALCVAAENLENLIPEKAYQRLCSSIESMVNSVRQTSVETYIEIGLPVPVSKGPRAVEMKKAV